MKDFTAEKIVNKGNREGSDGEDTFITKKELRSFLQNRREVNNFMWDVDPLMWK